MTSTRTSKNIRTMTYLAMLTAIVIVLQLAGSFIRLGMFSVSLVLMPIVVGAAIGGPLFGAWLGGVFGLAVLFSGDAAAFLAIDPFGTVVTVMVKGILAGFVAGFVFDAIAKKADKGNLFAAIVAAISCPIVNTGIFLVGCLLFFMPTIEEWAAGLGYANAGQYMILGLVGGNFIFELIINMVLVPAIVALVKLVPNLKK